MFYPEPLDGQFDENADLFGSPPARASLRRLSSTTPAKLKNVPRDVIELSFTQSDASGSDWTYKPGRVEAVPLNHTSSILWRRRSARFTAIKMGYSAQKDYIFTQWPKGYVLVRVYRMHGTRCDYYLYGFRCRFRSPREFSEHAKCLLTPNGLESCVCSSQRPVGDAHSEHDASNDEDSSEFELQGNHYPLLIMDDVGSLPQYRPGDILWYGLHPENAILVRPTIMFWPVRLQAYDSLSCKPYSVSPCGAPGTLELNTSERRLLPWLAYAPPCSLEELCIPEGLGRVFSGPPPARQRCLAIYEKAIAEARMISEGLRALCPKADPSAWAETPDERRILFAFGAEYIYSQDILRLDVQRDSLRASSAFLLPSASPRQEGVTQGHTKEPSGVFLHAFDLVQVDKTTHVRGVLYELAEEGWTDEESDPSFASYTRVLGSAYLSDVIPLQTIHSTIKGFNLVLHNHSGDGPPIPQISPPPKYTFRKISREAWTCSVPLYIICGRYYSGLLKHSATNYQFASLSLADANLELQSYHARRTLVGINPLYNRRMAAGVNSEHKVILERIQRVQAISRSGRKRGRPSGSKNKNRVEKPVQPPRKRGRPKGSATRTNTAPSGPPRRPQGSRNKPAAPVAPRTSVSMEAFTYYPTPPTSVVGQKRKQHDSVEDSGAQHLRKRRRVSSAEPGTFPSSFGVLAAPSFRPGIEKESRALGSRFRPIWV